MEAGPGSILILGAGINGAALARELVLNGQNVCLVDTGDVASGTTAYSSRLIHGGLRYLEHGDFALVRESLVERARLLQLAPHLVRPLELQIPVPNRSGGIAAELRRAIGLGGKRTAQARGLWLVRSGLAIYDWLARDRAAWSTHPPGDHGGLLPKRKVYRLGDSRAIHANGERFRWVCSYYDAQILYPERLVLALLDDARAAAAERGVRFECHTYYRAELQSGEVALVPLRGGPSYSLAPAAIVNASGPWVDRTLEQLGVPSRRLTGGTKGSHLVTSNARLKQVLAGRGLYAEAPDGRPIFVLPWGDNVLIGTTDLPFEGDPAGAVATPEEIDYLLGAVNGVLPQAQLDQGDVEMHYCGVRPLPFARAETPAAISRRHAVERHAGGKRLLYSLVGGKLSTCRSLAEEAAGIILKDLGQPKLGDSRSRVLPGGENYPPTAAALDETWQALAREFGLEENQVRAIWTLLGTRTERVLSAMGSPAENLDGTRLPAAFARWVVQNEGVRTLADLVERRLMLLFHAPLTLRCLTQLATLLADEGLLAAGEPSETVQQYAAEIARRYGKRMSGT